jgi:hypothetical protein
MTPRSAPRIVFIANLWTLVEHPSASSEWSLETKLQAIKEAGFAGVNWKGSPEIASLLRSFGLRFSGLFDASDPNDFERLIREQMDASAETINVQLADHDTPVEEAIRLTIQLMDEAGRQKANVHLEVHRDTCTETPEKAYAIADGYQKATGKVLRMNLDYSHIAVVKHLAPKDFSNRLLTRPELLQNGNLTHCRPFNGHHCQVPVTDGRGALTHEFTDYLLFVEDVFRCWLAGARPHNELWVVPELGPIASGYSISTWPPSWDEMLIAKQEFAKIWDKVVRD